MNFTYNNTIISSTYDLTKFIEDHPSERENVVDFMISQKIIPQYVENLSTYDIGRLVDVFGNRNDELAQLLFDAPIFITNLSKKFSNYDMERLIKAFPNY
jgi:hypothetical protein